MRALESCLYAEDSPAARDFYVGILGLQEITFDPDRHLFLRLEDSVLILFRASRTIIPDAGVPGHGAVGPGHFCFAASDQELGSWKENLTGHGVEIHQEKTWDNGARSIYFRDPAGNILEFATPRLWGFAT